MSNVSCCSHLASVQAVFGPKNLEKLSQEQGFVRRRRETTGPEVITSLLRSLGAGDVRSLADLHRKFNAHNGAEVDYKSFYRRLTNDAFASVMHSLFEEAMTQLIANTIQASEQGPFERFDDILIHDGTSFAIHPDLADLFPGRFNKSNPAAVELHITMSLFTDSMVRVTLTPDVDCERHFIPEVGDLRNKLILMDRGYDSRRALREIDDAGGYYAVRIRSIHKPRVIKAHARSRKQRLLAKRLEGQSLDVALNRAPKDDVLDLDVCWEEKGDLVNFARLICVFNAKANHWVRILTNLDRDAFSSNDILSVYALRWQIELLNKELKSHANLRRFNARNAATMEGLIWASLCAALVKRFLAQIAQLKGGSDIVISTQRVAKCGAEVLKILCPKVLKSISTLGRIFQNVAAFICRNARRANTRRDMLTGRFKLGLNAVMAAAEAF